MNEVIYQARRDLFDTLNVPVTKADIRILKWKQRLRLAAWEGMLKSLLVFKRMLDVILSLMALILLSPMFLAVSLLIILTDGRPVIYLQKRVGLYGQEFRFYKFRSMYRDADELKEKLMAQNESADGVIFKMKRDPRVMDIGRFIRRFSIDETPPVLQRSDRRSFHCRTAAAVAE
ncbi:MAG: sugar transferase [Kiritimatiellales bacterium]|nr:sugar transferase [Kiritimatiellales bacterium]